MVKLLIAVLLPLAVLTSCSSLKPVSSTQRSPLAATPVRTTTADTRTTGSSKEIKFLDDISMTGSAEDKKETHLATKSKNNSREDIIETRPGAGGNAYSSKSSSVEKASEVQLKYAILLNTEVEMLANDHLLEYVDEWYGTKYKMGGTTKKGIDCSAFVQAVYLSAFAVSLPRTARDQYYSSKIISATELKEGDLVFFNTRGGISHVGIYLQNNKFIHASTSHGVTVSDMFDPYYIKHYIGAGRIEKPAASAQNE